VKGIISGFLFGCFSLGLVSVIIGLIAPKAPETTIFIVSDESEFTNSVSYDFSNSGPLSEFNYTSSDITLPTRNRNPKREGFTENTPKLDPKLPNLNLSSIPKIKQEMQVSPLQPEMPNKNTDFPVKIKN
tara:strand:- start:747 stop:1136 length:390 start_codon:yes stop_codon:yes gene_type:complete